MLWINENYLKELGLSNVDSKADFETFLAHDWGEGRYAYGGAWEKTYVYNEIGEFINLFDGDYYDWNNEKTRAAMEFLKSFPQNGYAPPNQLIDQYEQMNQKFIDGKYGMVLMYSGSMNTYTDAGVYGNDQIHLTSLPDLGGNTTYIATWQYALNKASEHKEAAKRFLSYAVSREGSRDYAEKMNRMPAREDVIWEEELNVTGFEDMRNYMKHVRLKARPLPENSMGFVSELGALFQEYVTDGEDLDGFCSRAQALVDKDLKP